MKPPVWTVDPRDPDPRAIDAAAGVLQGGGLVIMPTETVYGLAADATNPAAIERLTRAKGRPPDKPYAVQVADAAQARRLVPEVPATAERLMRQFWPGPLTLVLPSADGGTVGIRVPDHPVTQALLRRCARPLAAPSANRSGSPPPATAREAMLALEGQYDGVLDAGPARLGRESTVVAVVGGTVTVLREGALSAAAVRDAAGASTREGLVPKQIVFVCTGNTCRSVMAHGLLQQRLADQAHRLKGPVEVGSAGVFAIDGLTPSRETLQLLRNRGADLSSHMAQTLTDAMIRQADLLFAMEQHQVDQIVHRVPEARGKTFLLKRYGRPPGEPVADPNIHDPVGKPMEVYEVCFAQIQEAVDRIAQSLLEARSSP